MSNANRNYLHIIAMLNTAAQHVKDPTVRIDLEGEPRVVFKLRSAESKYAGTVAITDGGPWGNSRWYGYIDARGHWHASAMVTDAVVAIVDAFARDPVAFASNYGHVTRRCCFCNLVIRSKPSLVVGYGPVCAQNFGLPWGTVQMEHSVDAAAGSEAAADDAPRCDQAGLFDVDDTRARRPSWWCVLHDKALAALTHEWRGLADLRVEVGIGAVAFDDLVVAGVAERQDVPLMDGSMCRGSRTEFRRVDAQKKANGG